MRVVLCGGLVALGLAGAVVEARQKPMAVSLAFVPQESTGAATVALPPSVLDRPMTLQFTDARDPAAAQTIGQGTDDDDRPFPITATNAVATFARDAVNTVMAQTRLTSVADTDRVLQLRLTRFNVNESNKAVGSTYAAEVNFAYALTDRAGTALFEGSAAGAASRYGRARSGANCSEVLSDALKDAVIKVLREPGLQTAWTSGAAAPRAGSGDDSKKSIEERLRVLNDLLKKGLITEEEYKVKRAEILKSA